MAGTHHVKLIANPKISIRKQEPKMNPENFTTSDQTTMLAMQVLDGLRIYSARILGGKANTIRAYKSYDTFQPGEVVIGENYNTFVVLEIIEEIEFDFQTAGEIYWIGSRIEDPRTQIESMKDRDKAALKKIRRAAVMRAARDVLEMNADMQALQARVLPEEN